VKNFFLISNLNLPSFSYILVTVLKIPADILFNQKCTFYCAVLFNVALRYNEADI